MNADYVHKPDSGSLFLNTKKGGPAHPDFKGKALIGGVTYDVSAWVKKPKNGGEDYINFAVREWKEQSTNQTK